MIYSLVLMIFLQGPVGPVAVSQEIRVESMEKCLLLKSYIVDNTVLAAELSIIGASAECKKTPTT